MDDIVFHDSRWLSFITQLRIVPNAVVVRSKDNIVADSQVEVIGDCHSSASKFNPLEECPTVVPFRRNMSNSIVINLDIGGPFSFQAFLVEPKYIIVIENDVSGIYHMDTFALT
jgi:hypothetical protein